MFFPILVTNIFLLFLSVVERVSEDPEEKGNHAATYLSLLLLFSLHCFFLWHFFASSLFKNFIICKIVCRWEGDYGKEIREEREMREGGMSE